MARTGYAVVDANGQQPTVREAGVVSTKDSEPLDARVSRIYHDITDVIKEFAPDVMVVEELYSHYRHPKTAVVMGHARGVLYLAAAESDVPVTSYSATRVKRALTGNGHASKLQVQRMVQKVLRLSELPSPDDVADALSLALCHMRVASKTSLL